MHSKKIISSALISTLLFSFSPAYANNKALLTAEAPIIVAEKLPTAVFCFGTVKEIITKDTKVTAIIITEDGQNSDKRFNISEETVIIDNQSTIAENLTSIKVGDKIAVYTSPISTFSIPPQSSAYVILTNIQEKAAAKLVKVHDITKLEDGSLKINDVDNQYSVSITKDTVISPYRTKQFVSMDSIEQDDYILFWSEIMTLSLPAQTTANNVVLLKGFDFGSFKKAPEEANSDFTELNKIVVSTQAGVISLKGTEICLEPNLTFYKNKDGIYMLPIRAISEALGYTVQWTSEDKRVDIFKESESYNLNIGRKECFKQNKLLMLENEPELINGVTYVSIEFLMEVMDLEIIIDDSHI